MTQAGRRTSRLRPAHKESLGSDSARNTTASAANASCRAARSPLRRNGGRVGAAKLREPFVGDRHAGPKVPQISTRPRRAPSGRPGFASPARPACPAASGPFRGRRTAAGRAAPLQRHPTIAPPPPEARAKRVDFPLRCALSSRRRRCAGFGRPLGNPVRPPPLRRAIPELPPQLSAASPLHEATGPRSGKAETGRRPASQETCLRDVTLPARGARDRGGFPQAVTCETVAGGRLMSRPERIVRPAPVPSAPRFSVTRSTNVTEACHDPRSAGPRARITRTIHAD